MSLVLEPLSYMLFAIPSFVNAFSIVERIEAYFEKAEEHTPSAGDNSRPNTSSSQGDIPMRTVSGRDMAAENASFAAKLGEAALLHDITFSVEPGTLTTVTGKVGSGKTLLLQGLLGELLLTDGVLNKNVGSIGYCSQSSWLVKGTIRRNITGWSTVHDDDTWYNLVVKACGLDKDFEQLPAGDQTMLSSRGLSLSGGQRHRVVSFSFFDACLYKLSANKDARHLHVAYTRNRRYLSSMIFSPAWTRPRRNTSGTAFLGQMVLYAKSEALQSSLHIHVSSAAP